MIAVVLWLGLAGFSFYTTERMLDLAAKELFAANSSRVASDITSVYRPIQRATALLAQSQLMAADSRDTRLGSLPLLADTLDALASATAIQVGTDQGDFFIVRKMTSSRLAEKFNSPPATRYVVDHISGSDGRNDRWYYDELLNLLRQEQLIVSTYDPRSRPWYQQAMNSRTTIITAPYIFFFMGEIGITSAHASQDRQSVVAIDIELSSISKTLADSRITPSARSLLTTDLGVLAWSGNLPVLMETGEGELRRRSIAEFEDPVLSNIVSGTQLNGWRTYRTRLELEDGIAPSLYMAVPGNELLGDLGDTRNRSLLISFVLLTLLIPITWWLAGRIAGPLRDLHKAITEVGQGNFDFWLPEIKSADEVGDLNLALRTMRGSLKQHIDDLATAKAAREKLESELNIARQIQMSLLPGAGELVTRLSGEELFARLKPAKAVGGDLYEVTELDNDCYFIAVGDVSDKGIPAALFMSRTMTLAKMLVPKCTNLGELLEELNNELVEDNDACMFITLFCAVINPHTGDMHFACAGHNPPVHVTKDGSLLLEMESGPPLGIFPETEYVEVQSRIERGERLVVYSDGITEAFNESRAEFTEERLVELMQELGTKGSAAEAGSHILEAVSGFVGGAEQSDDITLLVLDRPE